MLKMPSFLPRNMQISQTDLLRMTPIENMLTLTKITMVTIVPVKSLTAIFTVSLYIYIFI